jgi:hypothetical protein
VADRRRVVQISAAGILLAIGVAYLVMGTHMNLIVVGPGLANRTGTRVGNDFSQFYAAAREVAAGRIQAVYSQDALRRASAEAIGADDEWTYAQWAYPPTLGLLLAPLARLRPLPAYWTWVISTLLATALALHLVVRSVSLVALVFVFPGVVHAMICNQSALLNTALLAAGIATLRARPLAAGMCLGLLTYKPQAAMLLPVVLVAGRHGKAAAAWAATALGLVGASILAFGPGVWGDFLSAARMNVEHLNAGSYRLDRMPTPYAALLLDGASPQVALVGQMATTVLAALAAALVWRRSDRPSMQALALAAAVPLATPYAYDYDLAILVVPFVLLAGERRRGEAVPLWALLALWLGPLAIPLVAHEAGWHLGPPILASLVALAGLDALAPRGTLWGAVAAP